MNVPNVRWIVDLALVVALAALAAVGIDSGIDGPARIALSLPLVVLLPGYALTAVLFPAANDNAISGRPGDEETGLRTLPDEYEVDGVERLGLSVALSLFVVPLVALAANFTPYGVSLRPILAGIVGVTIGAAVVALALRWRLPADRRFALSPRRLRPVRSIGPSPLSANASAHRLLNVAIAASLLLLVASAGVAVTYTPPDQGFTEFYVDTDDVTGDTESWHPTAFAPGESEELTIAVANRERRDTRYTVVAVLQRVDRDGGETTVRESAELTRYETTVAADETDRRTVDVEPTMRGEELRLTFLLYRGDPPSEPSTETAYRSLHLWIDVTEGGSSADSAAIGGDEVTSR